MFIFQLEYLKRITITTTMGRATGEVVSSPLPNFMLSVPGRLGYMYTPNPVAYTLSEMWTGTDGDDTMAPAHGFIECKCQFDEPDDTNRYGLAAHFYEPAGRLTIRVVRRPYAPVIYISNPHLVRTVVYRNTVNPTANISFRHGMVTVIPELPNIEFDGRFLNMSSVVDVDAYYQSQQVN